MTQWLLLSNSLDPNPHFFLADKFPKQHPLYIDHLWNLPLKIFDDFFDESQFSPLEKETVLQSVWVFSPFLMDSDPKTFFQITCRPLFLLATQGRCKGLIPLVLSTYPHTVALLKQFDESASPNCKWDFQFGGPDGERPKLSWSHSLNMQRNLGRCHSTLQIGGFPLINTEKETEVRQPLTHLHQHGAKPFFFLLSKTKSRKSHVTLS